MGEISIQVEIVRNNGSGVKVTAKGMLKLLLKNNS